MRWNDVPFQTRKFGTQVSWTISSCSVSNFNKIPPDYPSPDTSTVNQLSKWQQLTRNKPDVSKTVLRNKWINLIARHFLWVWSVERLRDPPRRVGRLAGPALHALLLHHHGEPQERGSGKGSREEWLPHKGRILKITHVKIQLYPKIHFQLGGKIKSWHKRYFVLKTGVLSYWKSQVKTEKIEMTSINMFSSRVLHHSKLLHCVWYRNAHR